VTLNKIKYVYFLLKCNGIKLIDSKLYNEIIYPYDRFIIDYTDCYFHY